MTVSAVKSDEFRVTIAVMPRQNEAVSLAMETEASKTRSFAIAFLVDAEDLRQLQNVLTEVGDSLEYQVTFSDGHTRQFHDVEEIIKQPNSRDCSIGSLIAGVTGRRKQSAYVVLSTLGDEGLTSPSVEYTINGTHRDIVFWGNKLDAWTAGIRQWYSIFYHGALLFLLFGLVAFGPPVLWKSVSPHLFSEGFLKSHGWLSLIVVGSFWVGIYWLFKLFPRATFAVGQGAKRHQSFTYLRTVILAAFALSFLASLLANWFTRHP